ncbi:MAG: phosphoserine transaminase [Acidimicrobiales bacterium]
MSGRPAIPIPADLLPGDGRFGSGPSKVRPEAVDALAAGAAHYLGTSHRQAAVTSTVERLRSGLAELFALPDGYQVVLGNGGTTCFWDMATFGLIEDHSLHLAFGEFSSRFASVVGAAPHLSSPEVVTAPAGTRPQLPTGAGGRADAYALTHNETSTGVAMEVRRPDPGGDALVLVDATSAAGGMQVDPSQFDAYYFAPQKCFAADGGLWVALLSPAALARPKALAATGRWTPPFLDLSLAAAASARDQTVNTPALATIFLMVDQVEWMLANGGLEWAASRSEASAAILYGWAEASDIATPFVADPADRSPVVATIDLDPALDALAVAGHLRANGILDTEPYRKLGRNQLRIGMYPAVDPGDVSALTACIDHVAARLA